MTKKELEKLKPDDKVRIVRERVAGMNSRGKMDKWLGKVMTVRERAGNVIRMVEDQHECSGGWYWDKDMIECKIPKVENTVHISRRYNKTIAKCDKKVGIARCSPADEYDEAKGAIITVARLYGYDVVSDETGKVTLASEERRRIEKVAKSAADTVKELRHMCHKINKPLKEMAKKRMQKKLAKLEAKTEKLSHAFALLADKLGTETEACSLLNLQLGVMRTYADILRIRLMR